MLKSFYLQNRFKVLYSTSGHLPPDSGSSKLSRLRLWPIPLPASPPAVIDYTLPIIYTEEDSLLSFPSERSSVYVAMDGKAAKARQKRACEFADRLTRDLKKECKGLMDTRLLKRAQAIHPAFLMGDVAWESFGSTGYPLAPMGLVASANVMDARVIFTRPNAIGLGAMG